MKKLFILCAVFFCTTTIFANRFQIGYPNLADVTAVFNDTTSTLTINGVGNMKDFSFSWGDVHTFETIRERTQSVVINNGVTNIGNVAFAGCRNLTEITIPNSVTSIGDVAFFASGLTSVVIPNSVTSIGDWAFWYCKNLTSVTIPNSVTSIRAGTFAYCIALTNITIPNSVTSIEYRAFYNSGLTSIIIPESVTYIGTRAFQNSALTSVTMSEGLTHIGDWAFADCTFLTSVVIPKSVTSIGERAFANCTALSDIYVYWTTPLTPSFSIIRIFTNVDVENVTLHIPHGTLTAYQNSLFWRRFILRERDAETSVCIINNDNVQLHATSNGILIETREEVQFAVFSVSGQLLYQSAVFGSREIALPAGVYVVRVNGESEKVIVR